MPDDLNGLPQDAFENTVKEYINALRGYHNYVRSFHQFWEILSV